MTLYTICVALLLAASIQAQSLVAQGKRGSDPFATSAPKTLYATATPASVYASAATATPAYSAKSAAQPSYTPSGKLAYSAQPISYEQQQITVAQPVKVTYAGQPALSPQPNYVTQPGAFAGQQIYAGPQNYAAQPAFITQPVYSKLSAGPSVYTAQQPNFALAAQPGLKYSFAQPSVSRVPSLPGGPAFNKVAYSSPASVAYSPVAAGPSPYSSAGSVPSFSFSNPHAAFSNLGLFSQAVGKAYTGQQVSAAPQVNYAAAPAAQYVTAGPQQVTYVPATHAQLTSAPQVQYITAPQTQASAQLSAQTGAQVAAQPQYQQPSHQGSHSSPQYVFAAPQAPAYSGPKAQYARPGVTYA